jgi:N-acetylmuramoyl-L-alanine amidase
VRLALEVNPDLFISIHHNSSNTFAHGTKVYYPKVVRHGDSAVISSQLAETVNSFVSKNTGLKNKKIHEGDYYVLNQFLDPTEFDYTSHQLAKYRQKNIFAILTETGYIGGDARFLGNSENLQIIAESIASGILTFFSEQCCEL